MFKKYWEQFYNFFFREVTTTTKATTLTVLIALGIMFLLFALKGKKVGVKYSYLFFAILFTVLAVTYSILTR